jgi:hypothetical protein
VRFLPSWGCPFHPPWSAWGGEHPSECFCSQQSPTILTGTSLVGLPTFLALHTSAQWAILEQIPARLSTTFMGAYSDYHLHVMNTVMSQGATLVVQCPLTVRGSPNPQMHRGPVRHLSQVKLIGDICNEHPRHHWVLPISTYQHEAPLGAAHINISTLFSRWRRVFLGQVSIGQFCSDCGLTFTTNAHGMTHLLTIVQFLCCLQWLWSHIHH